MLCKCSLTILESHSTILEASDTASDSPLLKSFSSRSLNKVPLSSVSIQYSSAACTCYLNLLPKGEDAESLNRNNYLRYLAVFQNKR